MAKNPATGLGEQLSENLKDQGKLAHEAATLRSKIHAVTQQNEAAYLKAHPEQKKPQLPDKGQTGLSR